MTPTSLSTRDAGWIIFILALGAGFSVASIYYAQPLLPLMGANLHLTVEGMGLVPTLTQAVMRSAFCSCSRSVTATIAAG